MRVAGRVVPFSHVAGDCLSRLVSAEALGLTQLASDRWLLVALRLAEGWRMAVELAQVRNALLAAQCVSVEYAWRLEQGMAQAMLMESPGVGLRLRE